MIRITPGKRSAMEVKEYKRSPMEGAINSVGCHKEINKEKTENVSVGFRSWKVNGKFYKDQIAGWWKQEVKGWR